MTRTLKLTGLSRRNFMKLSAAAGVTAAMPAFSGSARADDHETLKAAMIGFSVVNTLDPGKASLNSDFWVIQTMFNGLVKFDGDMLIQPDLAESWETPDPNTWVFNLRKGVKFHNGEEMTSEDVVFTFSRVRDEAFGSPQIGKFKPVTSVEADGKYKVIFKTEFPYVPMLAFLSNTRTSAQIVSKKAVMEMGDAAFAKSPVGTGAFKLVEWNPNQGLVFEAHKDYFEAGKPYVARVEMPLIPEETSGVTALLAGDIHVTSGAPFADVASLMENDTVHVARSAGMNYRYVPMNISKAPFDDVNFRRAISLATDRESIVKAVQFGEGAVGNGAIPPALAWARRSETRPMCEFNPEKAKAELNKSKYGAGTEAVWLTWGSGWWKRWTEIQVSLCNEILGTKFTVEVTEPGTAFQRYKAMDIQAAPTGWIALVEPHEYDYECFHSAGWRNFQHYKDDKVDALLEKARGEFDQTKRGDLYKQAEDIIVEACPVIFVMHSNAHNIWRKEVEGFVARPDQAYGSRFGNVKLKG